MELDYIEIGRNVCRYRQDRGWKQRQLAERAYVSEQHISHIETAQTKLSLATLVSICSALEVDPNTILGYTRIDQRKTDLSPKLESALRDMVTSEKGLEVCANVLKALQACAI